jgi:hypothetical protein
MHIFRSRFGLGPGMPPRGCLVSAFQAGQAAKLAIIVPMIQSLHLGLKAATRSRSFAKRDFSTLSD